MKHGFALITFVGAAAFAVASACGGGGSASGHGGSAASTTNASSGTKSTSTSGTTGHTTTSSGTGGAGGGSDIGANIPIPMGNPNGLAVNPGNHKLYVGITNGDNISGSLMIIDTTTAMVITSLDVGGAAGAVAVNPTTNDVFVQVGGCATAVGAIAVVDGTTNTVKSTIHLGMGIHATGLATQPATNTLVALLCDDMNPLSGTVQLIDGATGTLGMQAFVMGLPYFVDADQMSGEIYVMGQGYVTKLNGTTLAIDETVPLSGTPVALAALQGSSPTCVAITQSPDVVDILDGTVTVQLPAGFTAYSVAASNYPPGTFWVVGCLNHLLTDLTVKADGTVIATHTEDYHQWCPVNRSVLEFSGVSSAFALWVTITPPSPAPSYLIEVKFKQAVDAGG